MSDQDVNALVTALIEMKAELKELRKEMKEHREETAESRKLTDKKIAELQKDIDFIKNMAARWKGLFVGLLAGGTFIGWTISQIDKIRAFIHGTH